MFNSLYFRQKDVIYAIQETENTFFYMLQQNVKVYTAWVYKTKWVLKEKNMSNMTILPLNWGVGEGRGNKGIYQHMK